MEDYAEELNRNSEMTNEEYATVIKNLRGNETNLMQLRLFCPLFDKKHVYRHVFNVFGRNSRPLIRANVRNAGRNRVCVNFTYQSVNSRKTTASFVHLDNEQLVDLLSRSNAVEFDLRYGPIPPLTDPMNSPAFAKACADFKKCYKEVIHIIFDQDVSKIRNILEFLPEGTPVYFMAHSTKFIDIDPSFWINVTNFKSEAPIFPQHLDVILSFPLIETLEITIYASLPIGRITGEWSRNERNITSWKIIINDGIHHNLAPRVFHRNTGSGETLLHHEKLVVRSTSTNTVIFTTTKEPYDPSKVIREVEAQPDPQPSSEPGPSSPSSSQPSSSAAPSTSTSATSRKRPASPLP